jgi:molybdate transport system substrate-binding protein
MIRTWVAACAAAVTLLAPTVHAEDIRVMTSGGFTAAYKILGPNFAEQSGNRLETAQGPSMGQ